MSAGTDDTTTTTADDTSGGETSGETSDEASGAGLSVADAIVLGVVEGVTEYLPVSSTGHLVVTERLLDLGGTGPSDEAIDSYTVIIQFGAILAVIALYRRRVGELLAGLAGKDPIGRRVLVAVLAAFVPAAVVGLIGNAFIDDHLLEPVPIAAAWIVGGLAILLLSGRLRRALTIGTTLDNITMHQAIVVGMFQALALWPGSSRSLVTIVGAVFAGMTLGAAVEFSFLLGLVTLSAATVFAAAKDGSSVIETYGLATPLIGMIAALVSALIAVRAFIAYLNRRDLRIFGWYRVVIGALTLVLVATNVI
jgi:undecaprenyl-diphosphatase